MKKQRNHIEKPEDKIWKEWFNKLSPQDHKDYMGKLGLTKEDLDELPEVEKELKEVPAEAELEEKPRENSAAHRKGKR